MTTRSDIYDKIYDALYNQDDKGVSERYHAFHARETEAVLDALEEYGLFGVPEDSIPPAPKFRIGDKVKIVGSSYAERGNVGKIGKLTVDPGGDFDPDYPHVKIRKQDRRSYGRSYGLFTDHDYAEPEDLEILVPVLEVGDRVRVKGGKLSKAFHLGEEPEETFNGAEGVISDVIDGVQQTHEVTFDTPPQASWGSVVYSWYFSPKDLIRL